MEEDLAEEDLVKEGVNYLPDSRKKNFFFTSLISTWPRFNKILDVESWRLASVFVYLIYLAYRTYLSLIIPVNLLIILILLLLYLSTCLSHVSYHIYSISYNYCIYYKFTYHLFLYFCTYLTDLLAYLS